MGTGAEVVKVGWGCEVTTNIDPDATQLGRYKAAAAWTIAAEEIKTFNPRFSDEQVATVNGSHLITAGHDQSENYASLCLGDSGGPLYLANRSDPRVVGVNSDYTFNRAEDSGVSWTDWHTRTSLDSLHGIGQWLLGLGVNTVNGASE